MPQPVFISYARRSSREEAGALHKALGPETAFLDTSDILTGDDFAGRIIDALLGARVFVAFVDEVYFERWYCGKEWAIALAAFWDVLRRRESRDQEQEVLLPLVVALGKGLSDADLRRLPPPHQVRNWPSALDTTALTTLVRKRLHELGRTFGERLAEQKIADRVRSAFATAALVPPPGNLREHRLFPVSIPPSIKERFVGRANDLWRLHHELTPPGLESASSAAVTGAIQGGGGFGKTCLAREYLHRFGPLEYQGGLFWVDASTSDEELERQLHGALRSLDSSVPDLKALREAGRQVAAELARALHAVPREERILFVVDNVPEARPGESPAHLDKWCPALADVTLIATSRARILSRGTVTIEIDVLDADAAVELLCDDVERSLLPEARWETIAAWVGHLPLVLDLLNAALRHGSMRPAELFAYASVHASDTVSRPASITRIADRQRDALRGQVPEGSLRGITEALAISYERLDLPTQEAARILAWLAPAPMPVQLLGAVCGRVAGEEIRGTLISRSFVNRARAVAGVADVWQMHAVLADFLRGLEPEGHPAWPAALAALNEVLLKESDTQVTSWATMLACVPAADILVSRLALIRVPSAGAVSDEAVLELSHLASVLQKLGAVSGERDPTLAAIRSYRWLLSLRTRDRAPLQWAMTQINLGAALYTLGESEPGTALLEKAVEAYNEALKEQTRERVPDQWAAAQINLGAAFQTLGAREAGTASLEKAVGACREALKEYTHEHFPLEWAMTQNNLGNALRTLGEREPGTASLEKAVEACGEALKEYTRERFPLEWAMTQNNLGGALHAIGERVTGTGWLETAVEGYREALKEYTRERLPLQWAMTQNNLGNALHTLGEREHGTASLKKAVEAYCEALKEYTRERVPFDWAMTQNNLANALCTLGARESGTARLEEAVEAYREALEEYTFERVPFQWAMTQNNLGNALEILGVRESGTARLEEAVKAYREALAVFSGQGLSYYREITETNLGRAIALMDERASDL